MIRYDYVPFVLCAARLERDAASQAHMFPDSTVNALLVCSVATVALLISEYFRVPQRLRRILGARPRDDVNFLTEADVQTYEEAR